jgi:hypothetical protein
LVEARLDATADVARTKRNAVPVAPASLAVSTVPLGPPGHAHRNGALFTTILTSGLVWTRPLYVRA